LLQLCYTRYCDPQPHPLLLQVVEVVCCRPTQLQQQLYCRFLESTTARRLLAGSKAAGVLGAITSLKKLCNHPKLIYDALHSKAHVRRGGG
jgi:DNA repair and recombination RAD54-like protein